MEVFVRGNIKYFGYFLLIWGTITFIIAILKPTSVSKATTIEKKIEALANYSDIQLSIVLTALGWIIIAMQK